MDCSARADPGTTTSAARTTAAAFLSRRPLDRRYPQPRFRSPLLLHSTAQILQPLLFEDALTPSSTPNDSLTLDTTWVAKNEWPPISKKLSSRPPAPLQTLSSRSRQHLLYLSPRVPLVSFRFFLSSGWVTPFVHLPVRHQRQSFQRHDRRGRHIVRQLRCHKVSYIADQLLQAVP